MNVLMEIFKNIAALIKVKTIVTLVLISVFAALAWDGRISEAEFLPIVTLVMGFYFSKPETKDGDKKG